MSVKLPVAIVTGASTGLGRSISIKLAQNGYKIILVSRSIKNLKHTHKIIQNNKNVSKIEIADIKSEKSLKQLFHRIKNHEIKLYLMGSILIKH